MTASDPRTAEILRVLFHVHNGKRFTVDQGNGDGRHGNVALCAEELRSRQRRSHFEAKKSRGPRGILAGFEDPGPNAAPRPVRVNEEGADLRSVASGIEERILPTGPVIAAVKCFAFAPATTPDNYRLGGLVLLRSELDTDGLSFGDEIRSVGDQLAVHSEYGLERAFDLGRGIVLRLQAAHRRIDQRAQSWNVRGNGEAEVDFGLHKASQMVAASTKNREKNFMHTP